MTRRPFATFKADHALPSAIWSSLMLVAIVSDCFFRISTSLSSLALFAAELSRFLVASNNFSAAAWSSFWAAARA
eukprot:CAMPEP_0175274052 /NCGR_PEP_ID=MMETSP0093-20121207/47267_1 /TAXON_ID=311494 /ORGANISM="Alexandrium monilatum, Strain CCMP3105" /LENGTH=74 /DNA_ID=CAMNT_0016568911 /DNA_START=347 /DNA_END=567 /DNA_ORIENTATION=-